MGCGADDTGAAGGRLVGGTDGLLGGAVGADGEAEGVAEVALADGGVEDGVDGEADTSATVVVSADPARSAHPVSTAATSVADAPTTHILEPRMATLA